MKLPTIADYAMKTARAKYVVTDDPRDVKLARLTVENARLREALRVVRDGIDSEHSPGAFAVNFPEADALIDGAADDPR